MSDTAERASSISTEFPPTKAEEQSSSPAEPVLAEGGVPESASSVPTEVSPPMTKEQSPSPVSQVLAKGDEPKEASSVPHEDLSARAVEQLPPQADAPQGSFFTPSEIIVPSIFAPGLEAIISLLPPTITIEEVPDEDLHPSPAMPDAPDLPSELPDIPLPAPALPTLSDALDEGDPPEFQGVRRSKLLLRKARNGAMCKPVLQIMLGRQLADQTKPALELLAKGETVVDVAALM